MKYLGIDYGTKRVGLASSDSEGRMAFPLIVLVNNTLLLKNIKNICQDQQITGIILGESNNFANEPNQIMNDIIKFKTKLEKEINLPVNFQKEFLTSSHSSVFKLKNTFNAKKIKNDKKVKDDSSAATLILQRYLDKINN